MPLLTTTTHTYSTGYGSAGGQREDLSDVIYDLFPEDTWAVTNLDKEKANATYTEWLGQSLAAPTANAQLEGDDASFDALTAPSRFGSYLQISAKTFIVSDSLESVSKAGRSSELARGAMVITGLGGTTLRQLLVRKLVRDIAVLYRLTPLDIAPLVVHEETFAPNPCMHSTTRVDPARSTAL